MEMWEKIAWENRSAIIPVTRDARMTPTGHCRVKSP